MDGLLRAKSWNVNDGGRIAHLFYPLAPPWNDKTPLCPGIQGECAGHPVLKSRRVGAVGGAAFREGPEWEERPLPNQSIELNSQ